MISILLLDKTICNSLLNISVCLDICNLDIFVRLHTFILNGINTVYIFYFMFFNSCTHFSFIQEAFIG